VSDNSVSDNGKLLERKFIEGFEQLAPDKAIRQIIYHAALLSSSWSRPDYAEPSAAAKAPACSRIDGKSEDWRYVRRLSILHILSSLSRCQYVYPLGAEGSFELRKRARRKISRWRFYER